MTDIVTAKDRELLNQLQRSKDIEIKVIDGHMQMYTLTDYGAQCIQELQFKWGMTKPTRDI